MDCRIGGRTMGTRYSARYQAGAHADVRSIAGALDAAVAAVDRQMSNWTPDSDLSRLNRAAPGQWVRVPANLAAVLERAVQIGDETANAFNVGVGDLVDAWGFGPSGARPRREGPVPARALAAIGTLLEIDRPGGRVRKHGPVALDLCGIAKGFGVDELGRVLDAHGIGSWLVGIDGEMRARGCKHDGSPWAIALESPQDGRRAALGVMELSDAAVATSGDYRHWAEARGARISHTMDPRTGAPLAHGPASVTVIAANCMDADAYATGLTVLGEAAGSALARRLGLDALFLTRHDGLLRAAGTGIFSLGRHAATAAVT